jgi:hypothetical protein
MLVAKDRCADPENEGTMAIHQDLERSTRLFLRSLHEALEES